MRSKDSPGLTDRMLANAFEYQVAGDPASARAAIDAAKVHEGEVVKGANPAEEKRREKVSDITLREFFIRFLDDMRAQGARRFKLVKDRRQLNTLQTVVLQRRTQCAS